MTPNQKIPLRFILECNDHGEVEQSLYDPHGFFEDINLPAGLDTIVATHSHAELSGFWNNVVKSGIEEGTILRLKVFDQESDFVCSGYLLKDKILISCTNEVTSYGKSLQEIIKMKSDKQSRIRLAKQNVVKMQQEAGNYSSEVLFNDLGAFNNELVSSKRELIKLNAELQKVQEELRRAKENMEVLAYSVSHDLKEPVRMVKSFMSLFYLKYANTLDDTGKKYVEFAVDGASRLDDMIRDLLTFYRATANTSLEKVDLNLLLDEVKALLRLQISERKATIVTDRLPVIETSATGMKQVFLNLISNAIKFVPSERSPKVKISIVPDVDYWIFLVSDNGIGIEPENQRSIFHLFKRIDEVKSDGGTGMSLAIVKRIVESLGGIIRLESDVGKGSTFIMKFPK